MSFTEKIDVMDLLISVLKDHEEKLDELEERFEKLVERLEKAIEQCPAVDSREDWL